MEPRETQEQRVNHPQPAARGRRVTTLGCFLQAARVQLGEVQHLSVNALLRPGHIHLRGKWSKRRNIFRGMLPGPGDFYSVCPDIPGFVLVCTDEQTSVSANGQSAAPSAK